MPNAANLVRGNDVRIGGSRVGVVDEITPEPHADGRSPRCSTLKLETDGPAAAEGLDGAHPPALGARPEVRRDHARARVDARASRTAPPIPLAHATPQPVEIDEVFNTFDEPTRAALADEPQRVRQRARRPRQRLNDAHRRAHPAAARTSSRSARTSPTRARSCAGFFRALGQRGRARSRRSPRSRPTLFRNLDTTFTRARRRRAAVHPGHDRARARRRSTPASRLPASSAPFLRNTSSSSASCARRHARCAAPRPTSPTRSTIGTPALRRSAELNDAPDPDVRRAAATSPRTRSSPLGLNGLTQHRARSLNPTLAASRPARRLQLHRRCCSATSPAAVRGRRQRHLAAVHHHRHPAGPEQRGRPVLGAGQRRPDARTTSCTPTRTRTSARPGQPNECEAGNEPYSPAAPSSATCPATRARTTERHDARREAATDGRSQATEPTRARPAQGPPRRQPVHGRRVVLVVIVVGHATSASRRTSRSRTASASRPCSSRRTASARTRRSASPASTSARSRRSSATRTRTWPRSSWRSRTTACRSTRTRRLKIRPRIFLEGNFFVDLSPGHAAARRRSTTTTRRCRDADGDAGPARRGPHRAADDTREDLQTLLDELRHARSTASRRAVDDARRQDPTSRARPRRSRSTTPTTTPADALHGVAIVNQAFLGTEPRRPLAS